MSNERIRRSFSKEDLEAFALEKGGRFLSKDYKNSTTLYLWECALQHKWKATALEVVGKKSSKGSWCPKCPSESKLQLKLD